MASGSAPHPLARRHRLALAVSCCTGVALVLSAPLPAAAAPEPEATVVLVAEDGTASTDLAADVEAAGGTVLEVLPAVGAVVATVDPLGARRAAGLDGVASVEDEAVFTALDRQEGAPWNLDRVDQAGRPGDSVFRFHSSAGRGVPVYVVDSGVAPRPDELGSRVLPGYTAVADGWGSDDCEGHGTHVAGTIASLTFGVAKAADVVPVRVLDCYGAATTSQILAGLNWIAANHPAGRPGVVNLSLGGPPSSAVDSAVRTLHAAGLVVVVAAGNDGADACLRSPARVDVALTVGATGKDDAKAWFSDRGPCLDLFAPGVDIASLDVEEGYWISGDGTSMAAPHVAGAAALVLGRNPDLTPEQVARAILARATPVVTSAGTGSPSGLLRTPTHRTSRRLAGSTRYETAVAVATAAFPTSTEVVLVSGSQESIVDGLVAAPFARHRSAPVLLSGQSALGGVTRAEIERRAPRRVWLVGGTGVLSRAVERELAQLGVTEVVRLSGADRYATAVEVARRMPAGTGALLASGRQANLIDAAAASGPAAAAGRPILLTAPDALPASVRTALEDRQDRSVHVIGGPGAVAEQVVTDLRRSREVVRVAGADRFATAAAVATAFRSRTGTQTVLLASAADANLIDAMTGGVLGRATLLVRGSAPAPVVLQWVDRFDPDVVVAVGGTGVVSTTVVGAVRDR